MVDRFEDHLVKELEKYKGISFPVKSSFLKRLTVKKASLFKLHPNPDDEFSKPEVGPSYRIISEYEQKYRIFERNGARDQEEPIVVERMHPDGYLIINGHHRWAAYYRLSRKRVPIKIVNLANGDDIKKMIDNGVNDKRATLDLDEVVLCKDVEVAEKKAVFPTGWMFKERVRLGMPALLDCLTRNGYDIWLYSSKFYSIDHIRLLMSSYNVKITGVVTGTSRNFISKAVMTDLEKLINLKYNTTLHIDENMVLRTNNSTKDFDEYQIETVGPDWPQEAIRIVRELK